MRRPGHNHLDRRASLLPREYASDPFLFGLDATLEFVTPAGEHPVTPRAAQHQHRLVIAWRRSNNRRSGAAIAREFDFSKQTWSRIVLGQRWAGQTGLFVLLHELERNL